MAEVAPPPEARGAAKKPANKVTVKLTKAMMHTILTEQPSVRRVFLENVPHKMSEREFWQRYLRSKTRSQQPPVPAASSTGGDIPAEGDVDFFRSAPLPGFAKPLHPYVDMAHE